MRNLGLTMSLNPQSFLWYSISGRVSTVTLGSGARHLVDDLSCVILRARFATSLRNHAYCSATNGRSTKHGFRSGACCKQFRYTLPCCPGVCVFRARHSKAFLASLLVIVLLVSLAFAPGTVTRCKQLSPHPAEQVCVFSHHQFGASFLI